MTRVGFILKPESEEARELAFELVPWLTSRSVATVVVSEDQVTPPGAKVVAQSEVANHIDIAVALGGDGTMLRAAALIGEADVPILGVNLGRLGFLTPFDRDEVQPAILEALAGKLPIGERARLHVGCRSASGTSDIHAALNDAVIVGQGKIVEIEARLDGRFITAYKGDGLIVCTPSGSTAYNLAAGGPILAPGQAAMAITPICPHALTNRPLVVPQSGTVTLTLGEGSHAALLTVDGQWSRALAPGDQVEIAPTAVPIRVFQAGKDFFDILRDKLHWGARSGR